MRKYMSVFYNKYVREGENKRGPFSALLQLLRPLSPLPPILFMKFTHSRPFRLHFYLLLGCKKLSNF